MFSGHALSSCLVVLACAKLSSQQFPEFQSPPTHFIRQQFGPPPRFIVPGTLVLPQNHFPQSSTLPPLSNRRFQPQTVSGFDNSIGRKPQARSRPPPPLPPALPSLSTPQPFQYRPSESFIPVTSPRSEGTTRSRTTSISVNELEEDDQASETTTEAAFRPTGRPIVKANQPIFRHRPQHIFTSTPANVNFNNDLEDDENEQSLSNKIAVSKLILRRILIRARAPKIPSSSSSRDVVSFPSRKQVQKSFKSADSDEELEKPRQFVDRPAKSKFDKPIPAGKRAKKPVAQILRRYREDNPDGSITWGFENDDGSYKEEIIGADCITRGKYGYVDPDGMKREYSYVSGLPCDKSKEQEDEESNPSGYVDYSGNKFILPNGDAIDIDSMVKNRARKPTQKFRNNSNP